MKEYLLKCKEDFVINDTTIKSGSYYKIDDIRYVMSSDPNNPKNIHTIRQIRINYLTTDGYNISNYIDSEYFYSEDETIHYLRDDKINELNII